MKIWHVDTDDERAPLSGCPYPRTCVRFDRAPAYCTKKNT